MDWHPKCGSSRSLSTFSSTTATPDAYLLCLAGGGKSGRGTWRERELKTVDKELARGNHKAALKIVKRMQGKPGGLRGFGAAKQVLYAKPSLRHLDFDGVEMSYIQPKVDSMLKLIIEFIQSAMEDEPPSGQRAKSPVSNVESTQSWELLHRHIKQHEAGHFIVAYLLGVLPRSYEVPNIEATEENPTRGHVDFDPPLDGNSHKVSSKSFNKFSCIELGGLAAEFLEYGHTEGFVSDVHKLYISLNWFEFTQSEAESYLRWAILNTSQMLLRHRIATLKLADAMALGRSIGYCIATIEDSMQTGLDAGT